MQHNTLLESTTAIAVHHDLNANLNLNNTLSCVKKQKQNKTLISKAHVTSCFTYGNIAHTSLELTPITTWRWAFIISFVHIHHLLTRKKGQTKPWEGHNEQEQSTGWWGRSNRLISSEPCCCDISYWWFRKIETAQDWTKSTQLTEIPHPHDHYISRAETLPMPPSYPLSSFSFSPFPFPFSHFLLFLFSICPHFPFSLSFSAISFFHALPSLLVLSLLDWKKKKKVMNRWSRSRDRLICKIIGHLRMWRTKKKMMKMHSHQLLPQLGSFSFFLHGACFV